MFRPVKDPEKYVYHYTSAQTAIDYILAEGNIKFNPFAETNDPREAKTWTFKIKDSLKIINKTDMPIKKEIIEKISKFNELNQEILDKIKKSYKLLCFTADDTFQPDCTSLTSGFYRGWGKPRMWATYGIKHEGVCLMFNKEQLKKKIMENLPNFHIYSDKVIYSNNPFPENSKEIEYPTYMRLGIEKAILRKIDMEIQSYFFRKHLDWKSENEFRWVIRSTKENCQKNVFIPIKNSLSAIICGQDISEDDEKKLIQFSKQFRVKIYKLDWDNGNPVLNKEPYLPWVDNFSNPL